MNAPAEDGEGAAAIAAAVQLPYAFARRFGVIFDGERVALRAGADPRALIEVRRVVGKDFTVRRYAGRLEIDGDHTSTLQLWLRKLGF